MILGVLGNNHRTAGISLRERFRLSEIEQEMFLNTFKSQPNVIEAFVLSTCNRTEIYAQVLDWAEFQRTAFQLFQNKLKNSLRLYQWQRCFYAVFEEQAVRHLFRVTAGLDSLILGEKQILGQVKAAVNMAQNKQMLQPQFHLLTNLAIRCGKLARSETKISCGGSSAGWAAVALARKKIGSLQGKSVLIIGAGKMGKLSIRSLAHSGVSKIYVLSRHIEKAQDLAVTANVEIITSIDLKKALGHVDFCICAANAPHYLLEPETMISIMTVRQGKELALVDLSVPRNIHPQIKDIPHVSLFDIDDLDKARDENMELRQQAVGLVETMIERKVSEYYLKANKWKTWGDGRMLVPCKFFL